MFTNVAIDSTQLDYHVALAQSITEQCMQQSELQNELYCQLIKQTSRHPAQHKSGMQVKFSSFQYFNLHARCMKYIDAILDQHLYKKHALFANDYFI